MIQGAKKDPDGVNPSPACMYTEDLFDQQYDIFKYSTAQDWDTRCATQKDIIDFCAVVPDKLHGRKGYLVGKLCELNKNSYDAAHGLTYSSPCSVGLRYAGIPPADTCTYTDGCTTPEALWRFLEQCPQNCAARFYAGDGPPDGPRPPPQLSVGDGGVGVDRLQQVRSALHKDKHGLE